jgi:serine protease AprX
MALHLSFPFQCITVKHFVYMAMVVFFGVQANAQPNGYFVSFTDKVGSSFSLDSPHEFLSERSLLRRHRQNILLDSTDLPVSFIYVDSLKKMGLEVVHPSKWLNGVIVFSTNVGLMDTLANVTFVKSVDLTKGPFGQVPVEKTIDRLSRDVTKSAQTESYGESYLQLQTVNGIALHQQGYLGDGMHIAVIDAGFYRYSTLPLTSHLNGKGQIAGYYDFVDPGSNVTDDDSHGMHVLSIMAGASTNQYVGSAPNATYWLFRTEDIASEYPIEADYWMCAAEKADSAGVDVINSSLGYGYYDNAAMNLPPGSLDGRSRISRAANMAVAKGMVVVNSAGNEGNKTWTYQLTPADASNVLSVGAVAADSTRAVFSSIGPISDGRIKPDVMAMGVSVAVQWIDGSIVRGNGTSYAAPIVSGLVACLWQKMPTLTSLQLVEFLRKSSHLYITPTNFYGYGIPNFAVDGPSGINSLLLGVDVWPNPFTDKLDFNLVNHGRVFLFDALGRLVNEGNFPSGSSSLTGLAHLPAGIYYFIIVDGFKTHRHKLMKR